MDATIQLTNELLNDIMEQELDMLADTLDAITLLIVVESPIKAIKRALQVETGMRYLLGHQYYLIGDKRKRETWVYAAQNLARRLLS